MLQSDWCMCKWVEAVERGDAAAAADYQELYQIWKERENASIA